jgi:hypothetical protein
MPTVSVLPKHLNSDHSQTLRHTNKYKKASSNPATYTALRDDATLKMPLLLLFITPGAIAYLGSLFVLSDNDQQNAQLRLGQGLAPAANIDQMMLPCRWLPIEIIITSGFISHPAPNTR